MNNMLRIGVFYDGQYFLNVSNYYNFEHAKKSRISIGGLHEFVRNQVAKECQTDMRLCQIVDSHYFRGRLSAQETNPVLLYNERLFDEILANENVITHYLPLKSTAVGGKQEKGIDVWLALEAYELAIHKRFDVLVLVACDGDYVPLVRKLNTLGTLVMLLSWDFKYMSKDNNERETRTAKQLLDEVSFPVAMHEIIDNRVTSEEAIIKNLFLPQKSPREYITSQVNNKETYVNSEKICQSTIVSLNKGYGFIKEVPDNIFFHYSALDNYDFNSLTKGMSVEYSREQEDGKLTAKNVKVLT